MTDTLSLTQKLIACPSVTPEDAGAQQVLIDVLEPAGFEVHKLPFGEGAERIENFFARWGGSGGKHLCFAGHTDVVPAGDEEAWTYPPFSAHVQDGVLYGRGASDMKGADAAFAVAALRYIHTYGESCSGSISMLITGDEEALAINGTVKVLGWMKENGHIPDLAIVGEPTNPDHFGQEIKIGRRGSLTGKLSVSGKQGHVAYQHLADNPMPRLVAMLDVLARYMFDEGNDHFSPTNLEITTIDVGNLAANVIPAKGGAVFNIRFNDAWNARSLTAKLHELLKQVSADYTLDIECNAESFLTKPGVWSEMVAQVVGARTGRTPALTTTGGTSDARFISQYCPVIECGAINKTIHQVDECASVADLETLTDIYYDLIVKFFEAA